MAESRLQRWARKKAETRKDTPPVETVPTETSAPSADTNPTERELAVNQELSEQEILTKYNLPDPANLEQGTDITGFLRKEIPEFLRRKALRSLWRSNPVFAVLDGLNEYDEDFSKVTTPIGGVKTAYKVGKGGFLDLEKRERERQERALEEETSNDTVRLSDPQQPTELVEQDEEESSDASLDSDDASVGSALPKGSETEAQLRIPEAQPDQAAVRFRPRMHFES